VLPPLAAPDAYTDLQVSGPYRGVKGATVFYWLLPYLEQAPVYDEGKKMGQMYVVDRSGSSLKLIGAASRPIWTLICPSEPTRANATGIAESTYGDSHVFGASSYAANYLVFGNPAAGTNSINDWVVRSEGKTSLKHLVDGTSQTIMFAERYASCGNTGDPDTFTQSCLWGDSNEQFRPAFCVNETSQRPFRKGFRPCLMFQEAPDWVNTCDSRRAQTPHAAIMNVCMSDGSVRSISTAVEDVVWQRYCDPQDGEPVDGI